MPAQSPTLSPTLSAITAGLRGSSSGMPTSTLPTRSAPTSAPFVKMPPPRRAKIEMSDDPKAKPIRGLSRSESAAPADPLAMVLTSARSRVRTQNNALTPKSPSPTTSIPVMAPPRNATFSAAGMPSVAAWAVRTLARTETFIPMKPQAPERMAPSAKANAVAMPSAGIEARITNRIAPTTAMVRY